MQTWRLSQKLFCCLHKPLHVVHLRLFARAPKEKSRLGGNTWSGVAPQTIVMLLIYACTQTGVPTGVLLNSQLASWSVCRPMQPCEPD